MATYCCTYLVTGIAHVTVDANSKEEAERMASEMPWDEAPMMDGATLTACEIIE